LGLFLGQADFPRTRYHCSVPTTKTNPIDRFGLLGLLLFALGAGTGFSLDSPHVKFNRVGSETGPPPEVITVMLQDRYGFFWIGSREGLYRYDGETFVTYRHDPGDPDSISGNTVRAIFEDRSGRLWFGTNTAGLNRLDSATGRFVRFRYASADPTSLSHDSVYEIAQDKAGNIWVATQQGLNRFDEGTGAFSRFLHDPENPHSLSHDYVTRLLIDRRDRIWAGTNGGGLNALDPKTGRFTRFLTDEEIPHRLPLKQVFALFEDDEGYLWVAGSGLYKLDPWTGVNEEIRPTDEDPTAFVEGLVVDLVAGKTGPLWIGTFGRGLHSFDSATGRLGAYRHDPAQRHSLGEDKIMTLKVDETGSIWVGTWGAGAWRLTNPALQLARAAMDIPAPENIRSNDVTGLAGDASGGLWVATRFGDLFRKEPNESGFRSYSTTSGIIHDIEETEDGMIWVGKSNGLERVNPTTENIAYFNHDPLVETSIGPGYVTALLEDSRGRLWVGTGEGGLQRLDADGQVVERFVHDPDDPTSLSDNYVKSLAQDASGIIWVGTRSGGLNAFDPVTLRGQRFLPDPDDPSSLSYHYVTTIYLDSSNRLWIGTDGGGLNQRRFRDDGSVFFDKISSADGLIDDSVMAILEDDDGSLWLSTKRGLSRFDPSSKRFSHLYVGDGLPAGAFEPGSAARTTDTLYFGSVRWLAAVPAGTPFPEHPPSPVILTSIRDINGEIVGEEPPWLRTHLEIPFESWLSLTVAVLDFNIEHHHRYQFRIGDEEEPWVDIGSGREITFMNLDPGTYEVSARAHNCQGVWNDLPHALTIHVSPPFWMTMWFRAAIFLLVVGLLLGGHRIRTLGLRRRNLELLELHRQRRKAQSRLATAYDRLRRLTRRVEATKEEERRRIARELHDEMGPALTAVIINLQLINGSTNGDESKTRVTESIEIVDRMVQQVRDLSMALRPPLLEEVGFLSAIRGYLETQAERTGLIIAIDGPPELPDFPAEIEITAFRVIQAAVSNVIRHAESTEVRVSIRHDAETLILSIRDNGVGFDPGAILDLSVPGSSVGLVGMRERVEILGGEYSVESVIGEGTSVDVRIPVEVEL